MKPVDAVLVARFVDKGPTWAGTESGGLASGAWPVIASSDAWEREAWPMPEFFLPYYDEPAVARWSEDNPGTLIDIRTLAPGAEAAGHPPDHGELPPSHVEYRLEELIGVPHHVKEDKSPEEGARHFLLIPRWSADDAVREVSELGIGDVKVLENRADAITRVEVFQLATVATIRPLADEAAATLTALAERHGGEYEGVEWWLPRRH